MHELRLPESGDVIRWVRVVAYELSPTLMIEARASGGRSGLRAGVWQARIDVGGCGGGGGAWQLSPVSPNTLTQHTFRQNVADERAEPHKTREAVTSRTR